MRLLWWKRSVRLRTGGDGHTRAGLRVRARGGGAGGAISVRTGPRDHSRDGRPQSADSDAGPHQERNAPRAAHEVARPTPEATLPAVKTEAPTPEPTEAPAAGEPAVSTAKLSGSARDAPDPLATAVAQDSGLEAVARSIASNPGSVYTWQDGEHTRRVRLVPGFVVQRSAMNRADDVVLADDGVGVSSSGKTGTEQLPSRSSSRSQAVA